MCLACECVCECACAHVRVFVVLALSYMSSDIQSFTFMSVTWAVLQSAQQEVLMYCVSLLLSSLLIGLNLFIVHPYLSLFTRPLLVENH